SARPAAPAGLKAPLQKIPARCHNCARRCVLGCETPERQTLVRIISVLLAAVLGANGLAMLFAGLWWYGVVPGVTATGPYNPHFVRDIGAEYLVVGVSLAAFAWRPREAWPALVAAAAFLTLHAGIHVFDAACGTT